MMDGWIVVHGHKTRRAKREEEEEEECSRAPEHSEYNVSPVSSWTLRSSPALCLTLKVKMLRRVSDKLSPAVPFTSRGCRRCIPRRGRPCMCVHRRAPSAGARAVTDRTQPGRCARL